MNKVAFGKQEQMQNKGNILQVVCSIL